MAAEESGFAEEFIAQTEQKRTFNFFYNLYMTSNELPVAEQVFLVQSQVIRRLAQERSCVIVGRCADYISGDFPNCLRIFVYAPLEWRVQCVRIYHENVDNYEDYLQKQDKTGLVITIILRKTNGEGSKLSYLHRQQYRNRL